MGRISNYPLQSRCARPCTARNNYAQKRLSQRCGSHKWNLPENWIKMLGMNEWMRCVNYRAMLRSRVVWRWVFCLAAMYGLLGRSKLESICLPFMFVYVFVLSAEQWPILYGYDAFRQRDRLNAYVGTNIDTASAWNKYLHCFGCVRIGFVRNAVICLSSFNYELNTIAFCWTVIVRAPDTNVCTIADVEASNGSQCGSTAAPIRLFKYVSRENSQCASQTYVTGVTYVHCEPNLNKNIVRLQMKWKTWINSC